MNNFNLKLFFVILLTITVISCGGRDISGPGDDGITLFDLEVKSIGLIVILSWDAIDNSSLVGYNIYRQFDGSEFLKYDLVTGEEISFTDLTVTADQKYEYYITAELTDNIESLPSDTVRIIPGLTTTWVFDNATKNLTEMTHDVAHKTGKVFIGLPGIAAFDIDEKNGYIYLLNGSDKTLMLYVEGETPSSLTNPDSTFTVFDDPSDIDYDSVQDDMWVADGSSGNIYHYSLTNPGEWILADSLNTGGSADKGQIDANSGDYWVVNNSGNSVEIYRNLSPGYSRKSIKGFTSEGIILALDEKRARAYAIDIGTGTVSVIRSSGEETPLITPIINKIFAATVEPESGDLWLLADDNEDRFYNLIKLSVIGLRIFDINTGMSKPTWMGVNPINMNVVVLNEAFGEPKVSTYDKFGESINTFGSFATPKMARILILD